MDCASSGPLPAVEPFPDDTLSGRRRPINFHTVVTVNTPSETLPVTETLTPADQAAVGDAIAEAWQTGTPVYPIGGGTGLRYGAKLTEPGIGLSLAKLNKVIDYPAKDLTFTAEPGITIAELNKRLAAEGQRLPVDVPNAAQATLGAVVAVSPAGPRRYRLGTMRDYVIGIRAVDGRGIAFSGGGRVVKNAAGYNLCRLLTGSLGTLGVITQVTLMVKPMPDTSALVVCDVADLEVGERMLSALVETETLPVAIELLTGPAWQDDPDLGSTADECAARLAVGFEGSAAEIDWMIDQITEEWAQLGVSPAASVAGKQATRLWDRLRESHGEGSSLDQPGRVMADIRVLPGEMIDIVRLITQADPGCSIQAHAGDGVVRVSFSADPDLAIGMIQSRLRPAVEGAGGSLVVVSCPDRCKLNRRAVWGPPIDDARVMRAIKSQFDPKGILNPGRFVF